MIGQGTEVRIYRSLKPNKKMCEGCHCDFYNNKNPWGIKECWHFKDAKVADKKFYPNFNCTDAQMLTVKKTLNCFRY